MATEEPILSFKAGLVDLDPQNKKATPRRQKGLIKVTKNPDDELLYSFAWEPRGKGRSTADLPDELLLFPGDAQWIHVKNCDSGRVFALRFKSSGEHFFFWMQSPGDSKELSKLTPQDLSIAETLQSILDDSQADQNDEMDISDAEGSGTVAEGAVAEDSGAPPQSEDRQLDVSNAESSVTRDSVPVLAISDAIPTSTMTEYIRSLDESQLESLYAHLPADIPHDRQELINVISSSQFSQALDSLSTILNQPGAGYVVAQQLGYEYNGEGVEGFLNGSKDTDNDSNSP